jgi:hypothetical protein
MNKAKISQWISQLAHNDPALRPSIRDELVRLNGHEVTQALVAELNHPQAQVRWEAAKSLLALADPIAAPGLLHTLEDEDPDVRWVSAEGLVALGETGLITVLSGLTRRARSPEFCMCAHQVRHDLKKKFHADVISPVLVALEGAEPALSAPVAAYTALTRLKC